MDAPSVAILAVVSDVGPARPGRAAALEPIANRPIAHHVLDELESVGVSQIVVVFPISVSQQIRESLATYVPLNGVAFSYLEHEGPLDVAAAITAAASAVGSAPCIVHVGSGLLGEPLSSFVDRVGAGSLDASLFVHQGGGCSGGSLSRATKDMLHIEEFDPARAALGLAGVGLFGRDALRCAAAAPWNRADEVDLTALAERLKASGGTLQVLPANSWRNYAGDPLDLLELNRLALERIDPSPTRADNNGNRTEGCVFVDPGALVRSSVIVGPAVIGPGAAVIDAYIGPYTSIGARARIEGVEIERSIISEGASVQHVGGRIVSSIVGRDARVFRDFSLPRALRLRVGDGTEVALC
jgi:glucose-1-phosphate thymidylyltransferase